MGLSGRLTDDIDAFRSTIDSDDLVARTFTFGRQRKYEAAVLYIDGLSNESRLDGDLLKTLMYQFTLAKKDDQIDSSALAETFKQNGLSIGQATILDDTDKLMMLLLAGNSVLLLDGSREAIVLETKAWPTRGVSEPHVEVVVRGPHEAFTEVMRFNTALIRRYVRDPHLTVKTVQVGRRSRTDVSVLYIRELAQPEVVKRIQKRLGAIDIDAIEDSNQVEELIQDSTWSLFPTIQSTERPDRAAAALYEGRVVVVVDHSPFVLMAPAVFAQLLHSAEDYYLRWVQGFLLRTLRFIGVFLAMFLPAVVVAIALFRPGIIPLPLLLHMQSGARLVPFSLVVEMLLMEFGIELIREAAVRLPGALGPTIGIVGGFILGDAAVSAGLISPVMTVIIALTAIASFTTPNYALSIAIRLLRFPMLLLAALFGPLGLALGITATTAHLCSLESFGVPYTSPFVPWSLTEMQDAIMRLPVWSDIRRPAVFRPGDEVRQKSHSEDWWEAMSNPPRPRERDPMVRAINRRGEPGE